MSLKNFKFHYCLIGLFVLSSFPLWGQQSQVQFGKNRIQYKSFDWQFISTYNFDVYYYEGGKDIALNAAAYAEADYQKVIDQTGFTPYSKIKIVVYNSASDMQQSNIGLEDDALLIGGQTNFVKSKIEVAFKGNQAEFRNDIRFAVSGMIINIMLYGGSLKDIVQSSYLLSLPEWYVNGAAAYISEGWSLQMDNFVRDMFVNENFKKPSMLSGREATLAGQSIWSFIAERYGKHNIANILNLTRILRNEEASIESTLGIPYSVFIKEWISYYLETTEPIASSYEQADGGKKIIKRNYKDFDYKNICLSPDGKKISYIKSHQGKYYLFVHDVETGKRDKIHRGGAKLLNQQEDPNVIQMAWKSPDEVVFLEKRKNKSTLNFYNVQSGKTIRRKFNEFSQVLSFSFSEDGNQMVLSADKTGQSDIFIYDLNNNALKQLTNDIYEDLHPSFLKKGTSIVFSSNRTNDTLNKKVSSSRDIRGVYTIFILPTLTGKNPVLKRVSEYGVNSRPLVLDQDNIVFLSDEKGINNLYRYNLSKGSATQVSRFMHDIEDYSIHPSSGSIAFTSLDKGHKFIYYYKEFNLSSDHQTVLTERQKLIEEKNPRLQKVQAAPDTLRGDSLLDKEEEININDYKFESDIKKEKSKKEDNYVFSSKQKTPLAKDEIRIKGPLKYRNDFGIEKVNSTLMIDPLRGLGILMEANMSDMMGNHRMNAGLFGLTDLKSSNIFGEYMYLKKKVDYKLRYDRSTIYAYDEVQAQRYTLNKAAFTASYPLSVTDRVSLTPYMMGTRFTNLNFNPLSFFNSDVTQMYAGIRGEYVYDNTIVTGMNMIEGTRLKVSIENNFNTKYKTSDFGKFILDLRRYQPIHKELVLATRFSVGKFFGNSPKNFLLGGMDNWLFNSTTRHESNDPLDLTIAKDNSDLLFLEYVTSMRGFNYSTQFGPQYLLFNAELRIPIIKYLYNGVVNSNFLKNLQFVAFTDVGSSWSGKSPFGKDNSTNTTIIGGGSSPFTAKVINYQNPFLVGYGAGVRTLFLGYYVKFDMAYGIMNNVVQDRRFYLTFGYDF